MGGVEGWVVLVRYGEIAVKGFRARSRMERLLIAALKESLSRSGVEFSGVSVLPGRVIVEGPSDEERAAEAAARVFGVKSVSPAYRITFTSLEDLVEKAASFFEGRVKGRVFRVRARRSGVEAFTSKDVERELGAELLKRGAAGVDLENPEYTAYVEVRGSTAFLYDTVTPGPGGLPLGSEEPVLVLFSGGFDSGVAAWRVMRRGSPAHLVYYDYGVPEALEVAVEAAKTLADNWAFGHDMRMYIVNFRPAVLVASGTVAPSYRTLVLRRLMLEHASKLAEKIGAEALVTGESIGQVASQTVRNMRLISGGLDLPVVRPLAGHDKDEIVEESRRIGLYEISSRQVEVCGVDSPPTPRGDPEAFRSEYEKVRDVFLPEPLELKLKSMSLAELKARIGVKR